MSASRDELDRALSAAYAEIDTLRAENEALACNLRGKHALAGATYTHLVQERDILRAQLAEAHALLRRAANYATRMEPMSAKLLNQIDDVLSASAEPSKPQLVECDACPRSGGCVDTCMKAPASAEPSAPVGRDDATLIDALRTCEKWFVKHSPTAPLIGGFGDAEHPMLTCIRAALERKP